MTTNVSVLAGAVYLCDNSTAKMGGYTTFKTNSAAGDGGEMGLKWDAEHPSLTPPRLNHT